MVTRTYYTRIWVWAPDAGADLRRWIHHHLNLKIQDMSRSIGTNLKIKPMFVYYYIGRIHIPPIKLRTKSLLHTC